MLRPGGRKDANPLDMSQTPTEVRSVAVSINGLFSRVAKALERERVLDRFYRGQSGVVAPGCGLGLSIVQRIAD